MTDFYTEETGGNSLDDKYIDSKEGFHASKFLSQCRPCQVRFWTPVTDIFLVRSLRFAFALAPVMDGSLEDEDLAAAGISGAGRRLLRWLGSALGDFARLVFLVLLFGPLVATAPLALTYQIRRPEWMAMLR